MSYLNEELVHFKHEPAENYEEYLYDLLFEKGPDIVDELLSGTRRNDKGEFETYREHIERRHLEQSEQSMVTLALRTGQVQGNFLPEVDFEEVKDLLYTALFDSVKDIAKEFVDGNNFAVNNNTFIRNFEDPIGYGIDKNLNLSKSKTLRFTIAADDSPFSQTGFKITNAFPSLDDSKDIKVLIKNRDQLIDEYRITEHQIKRFEHNKERREQVKKEKNYHKDQRESKRMVRKTFMSR